MKKLFKYQPFDKFVYRLPAFPLNQLKEVLDEKKELLEWFANDRIAEAIYVGSPNLFNELQRMSCSGVKEMDKIHKIKVSFIKYLSRMSTRCTPFGLFATCSVGQIGTATQLYVNSDISRCTRLDMYYLCTLVQSLSKLPDVKEKLRYYPNNTLYKLGGYRRYVEYKYSNNRRMHTISSVEGSKYLDAILKKTASGMLIKEMLDYLNEQRIEEGDAQCFIENLIQSQLLISELDVVITGGVYWDKMITVLSQMNLADDTRQLIDSLCHINLLLKKIDMGDSHSLKYYQQVVDVVSNMPIPYTEKFLFQIDATRKSIIATLGETVIIELQSLLSFFSKMDSVESSPLDSFRNAFHERYEEREIPLAIALDSELGIGYPLGHGIGDISPIIDNLILPQRQRVTKSTTSVQTLLLEKLLKAEKEGGNEIVFHEEEFNLVPENWNGFPETLYSVFQVVSLENGKPLLNIKSIGGSSAANLISRFAHLDPKTDELVKDISKKESELEKEGILAEIVHLPSSRVGNILSRPHLREYEIVYLTSSNLPETNRICIDDLMLSCRGGRLVLRSKKMNRKIIPRLTSAHNYYNDTLPIYRFLCDMQYQGKRTTFRFDWGELGDRIAYRPRVRYGNSILSLAAWTIRQDEIIAFFRLPDSDLIDNVTLWRTRRGIPLYALLSEGDNELFIDFHNILSVRAFLSTVRNRIGFQLLEFIFTQDELLVKGPDGEYLNECIVAFYRELK